MSSESKKMPVVSSSGEWVHMFGHTIYTKHEFWCVAWRWRLDDHMQSDCILMKRFKFVFSLFIFSQVCDGTIHIFDLKTQINVTKMWRKANTERKLMQRNIKNGIENERNLYMHLWWSRILRMHCVCASSIPFPHISYRIYLKQFGIERVMHHLSVRVKLSSTENSDSTKIKNLLFLFLRFIRWR